MRSARACTFETGRWRGGASEGHQQSGCLSCRCLGQVPQEGDVAEGPYYRECHAMVQVVAERTGTDEAGRIGLADEERRDGEVDLVREPGGEELGVDGA